MSAGPTPSQREAGIEQFGLPRALVLLLVAGALIVVLAGVRGASAILAPAFFAFTLVLTSRPLQNWLLSRRLPRPLVIAIVMVLLYSVLLAVFGLLGGALVRAVEELPRYGSQFIELFDNTVAWLDARGLKQSDLLAQLQSALDLGRVVQLTQALLGFISAFSTQLGFIVITLFFLVIDTGDDRSRLTLLAARRPELAEALRGFSVSVRRYWVVSTVFGLIVAVIDYLGLLVIGVPLAFTWGILAFVTNYIPNIGFVLGLLPPALVALLEGGVSDLVWVLVLYAVANTVLQTFIQPKFTSDALGINTTVNFLSLAVWSFIMGPLGALIAVPLTMFVKAVLVDADPGARWLNAFLNSEEAVARQMSQTAVPSAGPGPGVGAAQHDDTAPDPPDAVPSDAGRGDEPSATGPPGRG